MLRGTGAISARAGEYASSISSLIWSSAGRSQRHPAWRLLRSDHAALVATFLDRVFVGPNVRVMRQSDLAEALDDKLFAQRERLGADAFPKSAPDYLNDWAGPKRGWLRKFYRQGSDEPQFV